MIMTYGELREKVVKAINEMSEITLARVAPNILQYSLNEPCQVRILGTSDSVEVIGRVPIAINEIAGLFQNDVAKHAEPIAVDVRKTEGGVQVDLRDVNYNIEVTLFISHNDLQDRKIVFYALNRRYGDLLQMRSRILGERLRNELRS